MTFKLKHHNKILAILDSFNPEVLKEGCAYFAGGTLLALDFEEYRWSKDVDFISSVNSSGYKYIRTVVFDGGYEALFRDLSRIRIGRGTTDQYGIRMIVLIDDTPIKTEIIAEVRFELDPPRYAQWSPVACLSFNDCFTPKLLANSDRFMDDSVESRNLIDLAVLRLHSSIPKVALEKAEKAYEVVRQLKKAVQRFQERPDYRQKCFENLQIERSAIANIIDGIDLLARDLDLGETERAFAEQHDIFFDL